QPRAHELPEPIAEVAGHPSRELLVCRGAATGRLYVVDLEGRAPIAALELEGLDRIDAAGLYAGRASGVIAVRAHRPIALIGLDGRELATAPDARPSAPALAAAELAREDAAP